jgi:NAD-dependent deacetylase
MTYTHLNKKRIVILSGAGISAESGISTFRDSGGLWEKYRIEDVATPQAWINNPRLVLDFYNQRRKQLYEVEPNAGHFGLAELEEYFDIQIVTQNVDDLHERAGSSKVLHLHGELKKAQSSRFPELVYDIKGWELKWGDSCEKGFQLRPHIVWFGEDVPAIVEAIPFFERADYCVVIGTSLNVYPAAGLIHYCQQGIPIFLIDPNSVNASVPNLNIIPEKATTGVEILKTRLFEMIKMTNS